MHDDALKKLWQEQNLPSSPALPDEMQIAAMKRMKSFDKTIDCRDYGEVAACMFIILYFGWDLLFRNNSALSQAGCVVLIASAVFIAWKLIWSKRRLPKAEPNAPVFDAVKVELRKVENQIGLLKTVGWWYLLPLFVGVMMCALGTRGSFLSKLIYFVFVLALYAFIYWLNQWAVKKNLLPLKRALESLLHSAETGEPLDETHLANLRPIIGLSMGVAVKPVEFKVAFWQIAIFGMPGVVGIWFFLMLGKTNFNLPRMFTPQFLVWVVPFFFGGLLYSWLIQKVTERAVGIGTLGVHLSKGLNLILWDEIKEVRPFRFLHIRNLWLIRESGEKTCMHWTPLERHTDLKAAVESFAPANHPIRKYLSLLKPEPPKKNIMTKTILIGIGLIALGAIMFVRGRDTKIPTFDYDDPISKTLETIRVKHRVPALAVAVVLDGKIVATNAVGLRKMDGVERVAVDDKFHLGSITKSMTATVAARLVEEEKVSWTNTVGEIFHEFQNEIHPDYRDATLEQLLAQRGGAPGNAPKELWAKAWKATGTPTAQRLEFVKGLLALKPEATPGTKHIYSNQGYAIAGAMLEKKTGIAWEELMRQYLFEPLQMKSAGFGAPATIGKVDQPWGHIRVVGLYPIAPDDPHADNPVAIGPAGIVHCSIEDLAKYAAFHLAGDRGEGKLLKAETFKKLHTAVADNDDYALGWKVRERKWARSRAFVHNGSNKMFYAVVWIAPNRNFAVVAAANAGGDDAFEACDDAATEMIRKFLAE